MYHRLRWLAVGGGVLIIAAVEIVADNLVDSRFHFPFGTVAVIVVVAAVALVAASLDFRQIDRLTADVMARNAELEARNAALRAVYDVSLAVSSRKDPRLTIGAILQRARELMAMDAAVLVMGDASGGRRVVAHSAMSGAVLDRHGDDPTTAGGAAALGDGVVAAGALEADRPTAVALAPGVEVRISSPVVLDDAHPCSLELASRRGRVFSETEVGTVSALATQVGLALEAARLQDEMRALAVQGERERIAREMHDGLAQVLGYVNTKSQAVDEMLDGGRVPEARRQLGQLAEAARSLYVDVREAILSLSSPVGPERSVVAALAEYAALYAESSKLAVRFEATASAKSASLPSATQVEMFAIAREALTNVRKHARAQRVRISLSLEGVEAVLEIEDDGAGFEPGDLTRAPERWPHFGLAGMRERAESVGGRISWRSSAGGGTTVVLRVPTVGGAALGLTSDVAPLGGTTPPSLPHQAGRSTGNPASEAD